MNVAFPIFIRNKSPRKKKKQYEYNSKIILHHRSHLKKNRVEGVRIFKFAKPAIDCWKMYNNDWKKKMSEKNISFLDKLKVKLVEGPFGTKTWGDNLSFYYILVFISMNKHRSN